LVRGFVFPSRLRYEAPACWACPKAALQSSAYSAASSAVDVTLSEGFVVSEGMVGRFCNVRYGAQERAFGCTHPQDNYKRELQAMTSTVSPQIIASQELIWSLSNGKERPFCVKVAEPYQVDASTWVCPILLDGLEEHPRNIYGVSSLQALCQALNHAGHFFGHLMDAGEKFIYPQDRSVIDKQLLSSIFGLNSAAD
jgi:hypothetical protein